MSTTTKAAGAVADAEGNTTVTAAEKASTARPGIIKRAAANFIDPKLIGRVEGFNPRIDFGEIKDLAASIKTTLANDPESGGLLNDLRVMRPSKPREDGKLFELIDGDRRFTAIELLMKQGVEFPQGVPAKIDPKGLSEKDRLVRMFTSNTGKAFNPLEQAIAFGRMRTEGMSVTEIAAACGVGRGQVIPALALMDATSELQAAVAEKKITAGQAKEIAVAARGDAELQKQLLAEAIAAGNDKGKKLAAKTKVKAVKASKAKAKGAKKRKDAKPNTALTSDQLNQLGAAMSTVLTEKMAAMGLDPDTKLTEWMGEDESLKIAFLFGVLQGCKAAAGLPAELLAA